MSLLPDKLKTWLSGWQTKDCEHRSIAQTGGYCPDCGHKVLVEWAFVRCASCNAKRPPQRQPGTHNYRSEAVKPIQKFCSKCGTAEFNVVKKNHIDAYELLFAVPLKHVDSTAKPKPTQKPNARLDTDQFVSHPSQAASAPVASNTVQQRRMPVSGSAMSAYAYHNRAMFKSTPYHWQPNRQTSSNSAPEAQNNV